MGRGAWQATFHGSQRVGQTDHTHTQPWEIVRKCPYTHTHTHTHTHTQPWESVRKCPWSLNIKWGMAREAIARVRLV